MIELFVDSKKKLSVIKGIDIYVGENDFDEFRVSAAKVIAGNSVAGMAAILVVVANNVEFDYPMTKTESADITYEPVKVEREITTLAGQLGIYIRFEKDGVIGKTNGIVFSVASSIPYLKPIEPFPTLDVIPTTKEQRFTSAAGFRSVKVEGIQTEEQTVAPSKVEQTVTPEPGKYLSQVTVEAANLQDKSVTPSGQAQVIRADPEYLALDAVAVAPVALQTKDAIPAQIAQEITADPQYTGLERVTVAAAPLQSKSAPLSRTPTTVTADAGYYGLGEVSVPASPLVESEESQNPAAFGADDDGVYISDNAADMVQVAYGQDLKGIYMERIDES